MSTTRRGFLKMLGVGAVAGPSLLKAALKPSTPVVRNVGKHIYFDPANYVGETEWYYIKDGIKYVPDAHPLRYSTGP